MKLAPPGVDEKAQKSDFIGDMPTPSDLTKKNSQQAENLSTSFLE